MCVGYYYCYIKMIQRRSITIALIDCLYVLYVFIMCYLNSCPDITFFERFYDITIRLRQLSSLQRMLIGKCGEKNKWQFIVLMDLFRNLDTIKVTILQIYIQKD